MSYRINNHYRTITRLADNVTFQHLADDPLYAEYIAWLRLGGTPEINDTPPLPVPATITASQARVALHRAGLLTLVTALVDNPATDQEIKIFWEYEVNLDRDSPALNMMAAALGLTSAQVDDLFRTGSQIVV